MGSILIIDSDLKLADKMLEAIKPIAQDVNLDVVRFSSLKELAKSKNLKSMEIKLMILKSEEIGEISYDSIGAIRLKFNCELILTRFEDPENPIKISHLWAIHNLLFKPFKMEYLQENVRQCLLRSDFVPPKYVSVPQQNVQMEKIRKVIIRNLSDFGFLMTSNSQFKVGKAYKFYNPIFSEGLNRSIWARVISVRENIYELAYCAPKPYIIGNLRRRISGSKILQKNVEWSGLQAIQVDLCKNVYIEMSDKKSRTKLLDYFRRKFSEFNLIDQAPDRSEFPVQADIFISDKVYQAGELAEMFTSKPLYICINDLFTSRLEAEERLSVETVRIDKNVDRHFIGRLVNIYFPSIKDDDPDPIRWIGCDDNTVQTEMQQIEHLTPVGFEYSRDTVLDYGAYQEFAFANENEGQIKPIRCKILTHQPSVNSSHRHQVFFYAVDEQTTEEIELFLNPPIDESKAS